MNHELLASQELAGPCQFLSDISGLPIRHSSMFPELAGFTGNPVATEIPFSFQLSLGDLPDRYNIEFIVVLTSEYTPGKWLPSVSWQVSHNENVIYPKQSWINVTGEFSHYDLRDPNKVKEYLFDQLDDRVGGPDTEVPFMDYEDYTSDGLLDDQRYFANIYLVMMVNMKERGLPMAPILSARPEIKRAMGAGDSEAVKSILSSVALFEAPNWDIRSRAHMSYESAVILKQTQYEQRRKDPNVPIAESFQNLDIVHIDKGERSPWPYNILVVENTHKYGTFRDEVVDALNADGKFRDSSVITKFALSDCVHVCETGKIDFVIFDWCTPSEWEALMFQTERDPLFNLFYGSKTQTAVEIGEDGMQATMPDGKVYNQEQLKQKSEELDIRARWMDQIANACRANGVTVPRHFIVRDNREIEKIGRIISLYLSSSSD